MKWIMIDVGKQEVKLNDTVSEGDINSSGVRITGFPLSWQSKSVYVAFYRGEVTVNQIAVLNNDVYESSIPDQMLETDGSFKIVVYAVDPSQTEPYVDVRPAVWAEVADGLPKDAIELPADKDVGAYLTLLIDLQNKEASIDEMIARLGDIEAIKTKLEGVADGAEVNVQADWVETNPKSDAFIQNKPNLNEMEDRLREEISLTNEVAINAEASIAKIAAEFDEFGNVVEQMGKDLDGAKQEIEQGAEYAEGTRNDLVSHRANEYADEQHLTAHEKQNIEYIAINVDAIIEEIERVDEDIDSVKGELFREIKRLDTLSDDVIATEKRVNVLEAIPKTEVPTTLEVNTAYNFGSQNAALTLTFPSIANDGDVIYIGFVCREGLNLVVDTTNTFDFDLVPEKDTGYEIYAKCTTNLGVLRWILKYSEYSGVGE